MKTNSGFKEKENSVFRDIYKEIAKNKVVKIVIWGGVVVGAIYLSSLLMKFAAVTVNNYKGLRNAINS